MKKLLLAGVLLLSLQALAQKGNVPVLKPIQIEKYVAWTAEDERGWALLYRSYDKPEDTLKFTKDELKLYRKYQKKAYDADIAGDEGGMQAPWNMEPMGCSWYCGASYETAVSSELARNGSNKYGADMSGDWDLRTAWVEGVAGYGIGEYLKYTFGNSAARATICYIHNGYQKNPAAWKNNSRVKTFNLYENDELLAVLQLEDFMGCQAFEFPRPIGRRKDGKASILKFVITEVYQGDKYDDTAISELYFGGMDVHCLAKGSMVLTETGNKISTANIEDIKVGQQVVSYNPDNGSLSYATVEKVHCVTHSGLLRLKLENGREITTTADHPFLTDKGWASHNPEKTKQYGRLSAVVKYEAGDTFTVYDVGKLINVKLISIDELNITEETYTLELSNNGGFIANGFIVGQE